MEIEKLIKITKVARLLRIALPAVLAALSAASNIGILKEGDPGGDPIEDDPLPL